MTRVFVTEVRASSARYSFARSWTRGTRSAFWSGARRRRARCPLWAWNRCEAAGQRGRWPRPPLSRSQAPKRSGYQAFLRRCKGSVSFRF
jgi:hypothetical protein